tara:strand:- start:303 stop:2417 length:2115 start_codon:yes stop_codon:yes gene_type:complete
MGKILITEKQLQVLTSLVLREQEDFADVDQSDMEADMEKAGHKVTSEEGEFKDYDDGEPYALFMAKANTLSKAIFQSGDYTALDSKNLYYKYRRLNPYGEGGYVRKNVKVGKWTLEQWLKKQKKWNIDARMSAAKDDKWFKPGRQLGDVELEEWKEKYGDMVKKYIGPPPDPYASGKAHKLYKKYKKNPRYYLDKKAYKKYVEEFFSNKGLDELYQGDTASVFEKKLKKIELKYQNSLKKKLFTKKYQLSQEGGKSSQGWEKNPEYNPEGAKEDKAITKAKKTVEGINFSPTDRYVVMEKIGEYVQDKYDGNYEAAMSDDVWKRKGSKLIGSGWIKRGVKEITLGTKNIQTKIWTPEVVEIDNVGTQISYLTTDADGQLFLNNLWTASPFFKTRLDVMVENIKINQQNVSERFGGVPVTMSIATEICEGGGTETPNCDVKVPYPYTISSSCSQVPNGVNDEGEKLIGHGGTVPVTERISFEQLSKNRANSAKELVAQKLGAIGISMTEPTINWQGDNLDGTSGPAYTQGGAVESEAYKEARFVEIQIAIMYVAEVDIPDPPKPVTYKVGDFKVKLAQDVESWDPWWRLPPLRWPDWARFKTVPRNPRRRNIPTWMTIKCPTNLGVSGPKGNSMGSDISLKENINLVGKSNSGINIYEFNYKDKKFGSGRYRGVMAQEVPQASLMSDEGYLMVDYSKIDVSFEEV